MTIAPHGTKSRYDGYGCRCEKCREWRRNASLERRKDPVARERDLKASRDWKQRNRTRMQEYDRQYKLKRRGKSRDEIPSMPVAPYYQFLRDLM